MGNSDSKTSMFDQDDGPNEATTRRPSFEPRKMGHPCEPVIDLAVAVHRYLLQLARWNAPDRTKNDDRCTKVEEDALAQQRVLSIFGGCVDLPIFTFDLTAQDVAYWVVLYEAAMRCGVEACPNGFVFQSWFFGTGTGHVTTLYYDKRAGQNKMVFIDPSTESAKAPTGDVMRRLTKQPMWRSSGTQWNLSTTDMNYRNSNENLQNYFSVPCKTQNRHQIAFCKCGLYRIHATRWMAVVARYAS